MLPLFVVLTSLIFGQAASAQVGTAYELNGQWILEAKPARVIAQGTPLPGGGTVRPPAKPSVGEYLVVIYSDGRPVRFTCPADCRAPFRLRSSPESPLGSWTESWHAVERLLFGEPTRYAPAITRGSALPEMVLRADGEAIDVGPLLGGVSSGSYAFRLRDTKPDSNAGVQDSTPIQWNGSGRATVTIPGLRPQLYEIELMRAQKALVSSGVRSWVLVADSSRYDTLSASFSEARALTGTWSDSVGGATRRAFLRAWLDSLSKGQPSR